MLLNTAADHFKMSNLVLSYPFVAETNIEFETVRVSHMLVCVLHFSVAEFATLGDMKNALTKLDSTELGGRKIRLIEDKATGRHRRLASVNIKQC